MEKSKNRARKTKDTLRLLIIPNGFIP